jgi:predicted nucleic acid-binding protein
VVIEEAAADQGLALGLGEAATIALVLERGAIAVLDDRDARRVATRLGVRVTGTVAILVRLHQLGAIESVAACLDELERIGFRASPNVRAWALEASGEAASAG